MRQAAKTVALLVPIVLGGLFVLPGGSWTPQTFSARSWEDWASVAWRYYQTCWNPATGLTFDSCAWHYFTLWGFASNILGLIAANRLGLVSSGDFANRTNKILRFLNNMPLTSNGVPYHMYSSDNGNYSGSDPTDAADYGRLLSAEYLFKEYLLQLGFQAQTAQVASAVNRVNNGYFAGGIAGDAYGYYVSLGFMLWSLIPSTTSSAQNQFDNLIKNGPYVPPWSTWGVSGIPTKTRIDGEPFADAILEVGNLPQVASLLTWGDFVGLSRSVYYAQANRSIATGKPEFWTEGGLDFSPGWVYEWIVWITGQTWMTLDVNSQLLTDSRLPAAYTKLMFAYEALNPSAYTQAMLNTYSKRLQTNQGFEDGIYATGAVNTDTEVDTNQMILTAAEYLLRTAASQSVMNSTNSSPVSAAYSYRTVYVYSITTSTLISRDADVGGIGIGIVIGVVLAIAIYAVSMRLRKSEANPT